MSDLWRGQFLKLFLLCALALAAAIPFGAAGALAVAAAGLLIADFNHLRRLSALTRWLRDPQSAPLPDGTGSWEETVSMMHRARRRALQDQQLLEDALERSRLVGAALPDGVVTLDGGGRIEWCNPAAERHFAIDFARDRGQPISYLVRQPEFLAFIEAGPSDRDFILHAGREDNFTVSLRLVAFGGDNRLLVSRDITRLEAVERMRRDFVANVSHELRTPITVVSGFLETLEDMEHTDARLLRRSITLMRDQTTRMQRLVEDLLTLSRLETSNNPVADDNIDVPAMLRALVHDGEHLSRGRHVFGLRLACDDHLRGSESELRSAFGNLLSNAVRYTRDGGRIDLSWDRMGDAAVFAVRDTGIGIPAEHIPRITERFYRVDRGRSRETGGTGLGLAIVKHVLQRHEAVLEVESEPGRGSTFSVRFPAGRLLQGAQDTPITVNSQ